MSLALVTGASKGIGRSIALELAKKGNSVILVARNEEALKQVSQEIETTCKVQAPFLVLDLSNKDAAQKVLDWCNEKGYQPDILVNNAGYGLSGSFEEFELEELMNMMQINMQTVVQMTSLFLPVLKKHPKAYILNIASSSAYQSVPFLTVYSASKAFILNFSRGLRYELKKTNVSLTCVSPGSTETGFNDRARLGKKARDMAKKVEMQPEAVAKVAVDAMYKRKTELVVGLLNKAGAFFVWLLPKKFVENTAAKIYQ